jgi:hypothetical protein
MTKLVSLSLVGLLAFCACNANRWYGSFAGKTSENSTVSRNAGALPEAAHAPAAQSDADDVKLEREAKVAFLTFRKCRLRMDLLDATHARVSEGQTCTLVVDGLNTRFAMKGTATFATDDTFSAELSGSPTEKGLTGEYVWKFEGSRKP